MFGIQGMNAGMPRSGMIGNLVITESLGDHLARRREEDVAHYQTILMDYALPESERIAARRQLILLESDPGPARSDSESSADENAKKELRFARRDRSSIYRSQRAVILNWSSTDSEKRSARALLTTMFGKLDDDLK